MTRASPQPGSPQPPNGPQPSDPQSSDPQPPSGSPPPGGPRPQRRPSTARPDRSKLRAGFAGLVRAIWFIFALAFYLIGFLLHIAGIGLIRLSGLGGGSQQLSELPQPTPLSRPSPPPNP